MTKRSNRLKVTQTVFAQVHTLKDVGQLKPLQIGKITGLSPATIGRILQVKTLADYKKLISEQSGQAYAKKRVGMQNYITDADTPTITKVQDEDLVKVLVNLTEAIVSMTNAWHSMEDKLDEVLETKRPWLNKLKG